MVLIWTVRQQDTQGPALTINCPRCGVQAAPGQAQERLETLRFFGLLPLLKKKNTYVYCGSCKARLTSTLDIQDLERYKNSGVSMFLSDEVSIVFKFLAIVSLLIFWVPFVGLIVPIITILGTFKSRTWPRTVGFICLGLSAVVHAIFLAGAILSK